MTGQTVVVGYTSSSNFPTTVDAFDQSFNYVWDANSDAFIARLSTDGSESLASVLSFACSYLAEGEPRRINYDKVTCKFATTAIGRRAAA